MSEEQKPTPPPTPVVVVLTWVCAPNAKHDVTVRNIAQGQPCPLCGKQLLLEG